MSVRFPAWGHNGKLPGRIWPTLICEMNKRIDSLGKKPFCNLREHRAPHIAGVCLPLCWRCTGIIIGLILFRLGLYSMAWQGSYRLGIMMLLPILADGIRQYGFKWESNNPLRFLTGMLAGIGTGMLTF